MRTWLTDLVRFSDAEAQRAAVTGLVARAFTAIVPLYLCASWFFARQPAWVYYLLVAHVLLSMVVLRALKRRHVAVAATLLVSSMWLTVAMLVLGSGAHSVHVGAFAPVILATGILVNPGSTMLASVAACLVVVASAELNRRGYYGPLAPLFPDVVAPIAQLLSTGTFLSGLMYSFSRALDRVAETRLALEKSQAQLRRAEKMDAFGQLAGGVAHDFNNILTGMLGHIDLLRMHAEESNLGVEFHADLRELERSAERASKITRQLLAFSRKETIEEGVANVARVVDDATSMLRRLVRENVTFQIISDAPGRVSIGPTSIEQILMNLVINGSDSMPRGGALAITVSEEHVDDERLLTTGAIAPGGYVVVSVADSGTGIADEHLERVFEPFFTTKPVGKGTGLGLSTVLGIVQRAGGQIQVRSTLGAGTTFEVYLPRSTEPSPVEGIARSVPPPPSLHGVILLCEDDPAILKVSERALRNAGFRVVACAHPDEALRSVETLDAPISLLITDVIMPGMNGRELALALEKRLEPFAVLFISGYTAGLLEDLGLGLDDPRLLTKPFTPSALVARVRETLSVSTEAAGD